MMLEFAMRNGDIMRLKRDNFVERDGRVFLNYTPRKTEHSSGRVVKWPVHPSIWAQMRTLFNGDDPPELDEAVFDDPNNPGQKVPGRLNNTIYQGIPEQLAKLRADGYYLAIASCKPQYQCIPICEHFHLDTMVDGIYGASEDNSRLDKDQVIRWAFQHIDFDENAGDKALMVGDRWTDADGAKACGLDCLGCGWGYAEPGELKAHGAYRILDSVDELAQAVEEYFA